MLIESELVSAQRGFVSSQNGPCSQYSGIGSKYITGIPESSISLPFSLFLLSPSRNPIDFTLFSTVAFLNLYYCTGFLNKFSAFYTVKNLMGLIRQKLFSNYKSYYIILHLSFNSSMFSCNSWNKDLYLSLDI